VALFWGGVGPPVLFPQLPFLSSPGDFPSTTYIISSASVLRHLRTSSPPPLSEVLLLLTKVRLFSILDIWLGTVALLPFQHVGFPRRQASRSPALSWLVVCPENLLYCSLSQGPRARSPLKDLQLPRGGSNGSYFGTGPLNIPCSASTPWVSVSLCPISPIPRAPKPWQVVPDVLF